MTSKPSTEPECGRDSRPATSRLPAARSDDPSRPPTGRRARLADVALEAGVSKGIASRVLNDYEVAIRSETRRRVIAAAGRLRYQPHASARNLRSTRTGAAAMTVPDLANPVYARLVRGAFAEANRSDVSLLLLEDQPDMERQLANFGPLRSSRRARHRIGLSRPPRDLLVAFSGPPRILESDRPRERQKRHDGRLVDRRSRPRIPVGTGAPADWPHRRSCGSVDGRGPYRVVPPPRRRVRC